MPVPTYSPDGTTCDAAVTKLLYLLVKQIFLVVANCYFSLETRHFSSSDTIHRVDVASFAAGASDAEDPRAFLPDTQNLVRLFTNAIALQFLYICK